MVLVFWVIFLFTKLLDKLVDLSVGESFIAVILKSVMCLDNEFEKFLRRFE